MKPTEQQNATIAEFMGYKQKPCNNGKAWDLGVSIPSSKHALPIQGLIVRDNLKFHASWDWLMPVINKIHSLDEFYKYKDNSGQFERDEIVNTKYIEVTHSNVCQFIEWYNANK